MNRVCEDVPFKLSLVSNRGTQVWPTGSVYTECVVYYPVRFELCEGVNWGSIGERRTVALTGLEQTSTGWEQNEATANDLPRIGN